MATPPVFTAGSVLTAAQMNAAGMWLVKSQTVGTAVSSVTVTSAFSADYDNYKIVISNVTCSANQPNLRMQLGSSVTGYYFGGFEISYSSGTLSAITGSNVAYFYIGNFGNATSMSSEATIFRPFATQNTNYTSSSASTSWSVTQNGYLNNTTSYSDFTVLPSSGTITGGTIRVYGYRN